jgi:hypothetical protein
MTVGIGAFCEGFENVILASDCRGSYEHPRLGPNDEMGKQFRLPFGLYADIAGYFSHCESLIAYLTDEMEGLKKLPEVLLGHIRDAIFLAQAHELRFRFSTRFRDELGMTFEEWKESTNPRIHRAGRAIIRSTYPMVELIVGGFTSDTCVLLNTAYKQPPEIVSSHVTIGSGGEAALAQLDRRAQNPHYSFQRTILHIAEALQEAKVEPTVGRASDYVILQRNATRRFKARDPFVADLIAKYKNRDSAELDEDAEARAQMKELIYKETDSGR